MLERLPTEIGHKVLLEHSDGPWELEDNVNTASLVCKEWRHRLQPLRVPHLQTRNSLALARARPQSERERATTVHVGMPTPIEEPPPRLWHQRAAVADLHAFLALYPNARRALLVNLTPIVDLQSGHGRGLRDYLSLCAINVALHVHSLNPTDVYALKHLRIELNIDTTLDLVAGLNTDTTTDLIAGLETFLTRDHLPHLQTLQIGVRYRAPLRNPFRYPAPSVAFLDQLEAIQVGVRETSAALSEIPLAYTQTVTPVLFTLTSIYPSWLPPEVVPHMEYVQIDQFIADNPLRLFPVMSLPNLKAIFVPHGFSFSVDPDAEDHARELFADFARRKVEFVYGEPPVQWTLIDPTFQAYLRRKNSSM